MVVGAGKEVGNVPAKPGAGGQRAGGRCEDGADAVDRFQVEGVVGVPGVHGGDPHPVQEILSLNSDKSDVSGASELISTVPTSSV